MSEPAWFESEQPTRRALVHELQRIKTRTIARPVRVILLAIVMTGLIALKVKTKKPLVEGEVVLLLREGQMAQKTEVAPISVEQLREYVTTVLLPDEKLLALIKKRGLYKIRATMGDEFAIGELREQIEITIWKNSFVYYDEDIENPEHSARIGIAVTDTDPDRAIELAQDLASIVIDTAAEHQREMAGKLAAEVAVYREGLIKRSDELAADHARLLTAQIEAQKAHHDGIAAAMTVRISELEHDQQSVETQLASAINSRDAVADQIAAAGLDTSLQIVEEHRPERNEHAEFVFIMVCVVVAFCSLLGSALVFGAFDSRLHDLDDLTRLNVPVLGHIPGFAGDKTGSLETRGAVRRRVPSFLRWRSR